jgi:three-Cys-motif partner protein
MSGQGNLFSDLPPPIGKPLRFRPQQRPLWTEDKARLIERYLFYFVLITKHGAYIDGFAAPQDPENPSSWAAKLVLESKPQFLREFWLCDFSQEGADALKQMVAAQPRVRGRTIAIIEGDFNSEVDAILARSKIDEKTAAFCLIDQRTFECEWETVRKLAQHKKQTKIEIFYFLASGWLDRSIEGTTRNISTVERWWGRPDWAELRKMSTWPRAFAVAKRLKDELGYAYAYPFPIYDRQQRRRLMYHMVHASDHAEAPKLMNRAYFNATKAREPIDQVQFELGLK